MERIGLLSSVDIVFDSHEEGIEKPDPEYFLRALQRCGGNPETTLHVGDFYHVDVMGARSAGIDPILLDSANLYSECDCPRIKSFSGLIEVLMPSHRDSDPTSLPNPIAA
jgi:putative hydrolase of the HAD superfamily